MSIHSAMSTEEIKILCFGITREILGVGSASMPSREFQTVGSLRDYLSSKYPKLGKLKSLKIAVNDEYASDDHIIQAGDEIVLIPPVSGG